jgi:hypothetical protein
MGLLPAPGGGGTLLMRRGRASGNLSMGLAMLLRTEDLCRLADIATRGIGNCICSAYIQLKLSMKYTCTRVLFA